MDFSENIASAVALIRAKGARGMAFTGAGISVESGIPPFRGPGGLWHKYDPEFIELNYFYAHPERSWAQIREVFYDNWGGAVPNGAHKAVTQLEQEGCLHTVVTQNIDCLHQRAGSKHVLEFHGTLDKLLCTECGRRFGTTRKLIEPERPSCPECGGLLKPDFVFFSEGIPDDAFEGSFAAASGCDYVIVIGTTGEVMPACEVPREAKRHGAKIIEVNLQESAYTNSVTDIFLRGRAVEVMETLLRKVQACD